jgi:hypothetical protein
MHAGRQSRRAPPVVSMTTNDDPVERTDDVRGAYAGLVWGRLAAGRGRLAAGRDGSGRRFRPRELRFYSGGGYGGVHVSLSLVLDSRGDSAR